jgi:hypothetical protein
MLDFHEAAGSDFRANVLEMAERQGTGELYGHFRCNAGQTDRWDIPSYRGLLK